MTTRECNAIETHGGQQRADLQASGIKRPWFQHSECEAIRNTAIPSADTTAACLRGRRPIPQRGAQRDHSKCPALAGKITTAKQSRGDAEIAMDHTHVRRSLDALPYLHCKRAICKHTRATRTQKHEPEPVKIFEYTLYGKTQMGGKTLSITHAATL